MIITTTNKIEGREIAEYLGIVTSEVVNGVNMIKDIGTSFRNLVGGRTSALEDEILKAKDTCIRELEERAFNMDADAVIGLKLDIEPLMSGGMILIHAVGTAVRFR